MDRVLVDHAGVTFRAKGRCMYPTIRAGDVLRIQSRAVADVAIGDIAVFRRATYLLAHRVIGKGAHEGRAYIVTRPDGASESSDGPTFDENLLGTVTAIERRGKPVSLQPTVYPWLLRRYFDLRLTLMHLAERRRPWCADALARIQDSPLYRRLAGLWLTVMQPRLEYTVRLPIAAFGNSIYRRVAPESFDLRTDWRGRPIERWTLTLHMNGQRDPAAWTTLVRNAGTWSVEDSFLRPRYRGTNLDHMLMGRVEAILGRECVSQQREGQAERDPSSSYVASY